MINKPAGVLSIPTTPGQRDSEDTILRRAREYAAHKHGRRSYVGMLHRLDRDTSGALAIALSSDAHAAGRELFKHHRFERHYLALVQGSPATDQGTIASRISSDYRDGKRRIVNAQQPGMEATTDYIVRERFAQSALVELRLHTGRQHQIRLHLEKLGHPLLGERCTQRTNLGLSPTAAEGLSSTADAARLDVGIPAPDHRCPYLGRSRASRRLPGAAPENETNLNSPHD